MGADINAEDVEVRRMTTLDTLKQVLIHEDMVEYSHNWRQNLSEEVAAHHPFANFSREDFLASALQDIKELRKMIEEGTQAQVGEKVLKMATQRLRQYLHKVAKTAMHSGDITTLRSAIDMAIEIGLDHGGFEIGLMALEQ